MSELLNDEILEEEEEQITFIVDDDQKAEWCMEKIREATAEKEQWKKFYADQYAKVEASADAKIARMEYFLEQYFKTVPHKTTATQESYALPSGKLVIKQQQPEYTRDDATIIEWMAEHDTSMHFIKIKESVDWAEFKKVLTRNGEMMVTADGEIVPGITVTERGPVFKVEVKA